MCFVELVGIFVLISQRDDARADHAQQVAFTKLWKRRAYQAGYENGLLVERGDAA